MTSFDFLSGFNNIDPKFILDAIDLMQTVEASDAEKGDYEHGKLYDSQKRELSEDRYWWRRLS